MIYPNRCCLTVWIVLTLCVSSSTSPVAGERSDAFKAEEIEAEEIEAVFRISKTFLAEVIDRPIVADIPLCASVLNFRCDGLIHAEGKLSLALQQSGQRALFEVTSRGHGDTYVRGVRGPIVAYGPAWGPFTSRTLVRFDGRRFAHVQTIPNATVCAERSSCL